MGLEDHVSAAEDGRGMKETRSGYIITRKDKPKTPARIEKRNEVADHAEDVSSGGQG